MPDEAKAVSAVAPRRSWGESLGIYRHPRVIVMLFLGFSAGLPFLLIFSTLSAWLREAEVSHAVIGFFSWLGITFSIKVVWAPVVDRLPLPALTRLLGRRRSWMLLAQLGIAAGLAGIATSDPGAALAPLVAFGILIAFASATQDIAIDAYRIEAVTPDLQGGMAATYQLGYRLALLASGAGALYIAEFYSWNMAYGVMAALVGVGLATVLVIREPEVNRIPPEAIDAEAVAAYLASRPGLGPRARRIHGWVYGAVICPFVDFFRRNGKFALIILLFISIYRISDITMGVMANPFYIDLGFTKAEIASIGKVFGFFMTILGAFLGGTLVARYGIGRPLVLGAALVAATNLLFAVMALHGADLRLLAVTISTDNLSAGIAGSVFIAYLWILTNSAYTATQYALFSSLMTLPGKFIGGFSGVVVESAGYANFFVYAAGMGVPAILLAVYLMHRVSVRTA
jgi:PAT family beta-lactamase induction signal transducer AmpG